MSNSNLMHLIGNSEKTSSDDRLETAAEAAGIGTWDFDPRSGQLDWDDRCRELFGVLSSSDVDYDTFLQGIHPEDREYVDQAVQQALDPSGSGRYHAAFRVTGLENGKLRHVTVTGRAFFDERDGSKQAIRFAGAIIDISEIRATEAELKKTESRYRMVLEATNDAIWDWDLVQNQVRWSEALYSVFSHDRDKVEPTGEWWLDQIHPGDRERVDQDIHSVIEGESIEWEAGYRFRRGNGTYADVYDRGSIVRDATGKPLRMIGAVLDLSELREVKRTLAANEERYWALTEVSPQIVWMADVDGTLTYANQRWFDYSGLSRDSSAHRGWVEAIHPDYRAALAGAWVHGSRAGIEWSVELPLRRGSDDSWRWHHIRSRPAKGEDGKVTNWIGVAADVHDRRQATEALAAETARLETLQRVGAELSAELELETLIQKVTDAGVALTDAQFGAFFYNSADGDENYHLYTLSGADRSDFEKLGRPRITDIFRPTFSGEGAIRSDDVTKDPRYGRNSPHAGMPKGHLPVRSYLAVPVIGRKNEGIGAMLFGHPEAGRFTRQHERLVTGIAAHASVAIDNARLYRSAQDELNERRRVERDLRELTDTLEERVEEEITLRSRAEDALRQAQKMEAVGQLTGGIAHDFNNLLTVIAGNIDMATRAVESAGDANPRVMRALDGAQKGAQRAAALTQRLLAFARRQPLNPKPILVDRLIRGMSDLLDRSLGERVEVEFVGSPGLWKVEVDPHELESAIVNLAVNARDAMPDGGKLTIEVSNSRLDEAYAAEHAEVAAGQYVMLAISDTGGGMPSDLLDKVFEPFFTTKEVGKGTGLGLSMVYGLVKQSGGHVKIYSEQGLGTTVKIYLPRFHDGEAAIEEPRAEDEPEKSHQEELILLVEDDEDVRTYTSDCLRELGYRVLEANSGEDAMELLHRSEEVIDLLFTDVVMPGMNGEELAIALRKDRPDLKVLYASGYTRDAIMHSGRLQRGVALLPKPFNFGELARKLRDVLELGCAGRAVALVDEGRGNGPARDALGSSGYEVDVVHTARELQDKIRHARGRFDCVVVDDRLHRADLEKTIIALRSRAEDLPVLVLSEDWERLRHLEDRCLAVAPTPNRPSEVTALLRRLKVRCNHKEPGDA